MIFAGAGGERFLQNALHAELLGCVAGLKAAANLGMSQVVLETDASVVKAAINGEEYRLSSLGGLVAELQALVFKFVNCCVVVCPRTCNKAADILAAFGRSLSSGLQTT